MITAVKVGKLHPLSWMMHHCPVAIVTAVEVNDLRPNPQNSCSCVCRCWSHWTHPLPSPPSWDMNHCITAMVTAVEVCELILFPLPQAEIWTTVSLLWLQLLKSVNSSSSLSPKLRYERLYRCYDYSCWSLWTHPSSWAWCVIDWRRWVTTRASWSFVCPKPGSATPMTLPTISTHKGNSQRTRRACRPTSPGSVSSLVCVWWPAPPFLLTGGTAGEHSGRVGQHHQVVSSVSCLMTCPTFSAHSKNIWHAGHHHQEGFLLCSVSADKSMQVEQFCTT